MWKESDKKLVVRLKSSSTLFLLLLLMHLGAWASLLIVPMPWHVKAMLVFAVGISLRVSLFKHILRRGRSAIVGLELHGDECALRMDKAQTWAPARVAGTFVHPWLVVLRLRIDGRRSSLVVVLPRGAIDAGSFRELRVRLRSRNMITTGGADL